MLRLGRVKVATRAVVASIAFARCLALGVELFLRAEARVHGAALFQLFERCGIRVHALHLEIRTSLATDLGTFIPIEPQPLHGVQDDVDVFLRGALGVGVLDAQDERAAHGAGKRPVEDGGAGSADVKPSRRGRRETNANLFSHTYFLSLLPITIDSIDTMKDTTSHTMPMPIQNSVGNAQMSRLS